MLYKNYQVGREPKFRTAAARARVYTGRLWASFQVAEAIRAMCSEGCVMADNINVETACSCRINIRVF